MPFTLKGKPLHVSREFVRAWIHATLSVLGYHNKLAPQGLTLVLVWDPPGDWMGQWSELNGRVDLRADLGIEDMATTILHELIHACCGPFGGDTEEKCTSTLTARLKPTVAAVADALLLNTYKNAAYFAHTRLSYRATSGDHYDTDEDQPIGVKDRYRR